MDNSTGVDAALGSAAHAREVEERTSRERAERWAVALADGVARQIRAPLAGNEATGAWRTTDGSLTHGAEVPLAPVASGDAASDAGRLTLDVDGGDLGVLKVVVDRVDGGVRVLLGVENQRAEAAALPERATLLRALSAAGLRVVSFDVVPSVKVGTVLAEYRRIHHAADGRAFPEADDDAKKPSRSGAAGRVSLIG